jgi:hypothetical protein
MGNKPQTTAEGSKRSSSMKTSGISVHPAEVLIRKLDALAKGKDVVFTIENPNKEQTNKRYIKHKVRGREYQKYMQGSSDMKGARNPLLSIGVE